jgi:branched-chain amino acid transport system permease protein
LVLGIDLAVAALFAASLHFIMGPAGMHSFGHAAYFGVGAYAAALLVLRAGASSEVALLLAPFVSALVAAPIAWFAVRLSGVYLAMATLGFGEVVRVLILNTEDWTGGALGLNGIPQLTQWWHVALAVLLTLFVLARMRRSKVGRAFEAIKEDETAAGLMGINVAGTKLLAFVLGAAIAGLAGALNAHLTFFIGPNEFGFDRGVEILTMTILGGTNGLTGPVLGSLILSLLPELLRAFKDFRLVVNGVILMVIVLFLPKGISDPARFARWFGIKRGGTMPGAAASNESH